jgi:L-lysine exporter family protein LysE/ArgO
MKPFLSGVLLSLSLCLDLGIVNVAAIRTGLTAGPARSFALGAGSCVGDLIYAAAAMLGVTALLALPAVRWILWIVGSGVLLWLCGRAARDAWRAGGTAIRDPAVGIDRTPVGRYFLQGLALALASPSAILWFATVGGAVIATTAGTGAAPTTALLFFAGFAAAGLIWSLGIALVSAHGRVFGASIVRVLNVASAVLFAWLAAAVIVDGYRSFITASP